MIHVERIALIVKLNLDAKEIDVVILMYNLREYGNNYQKHQEVYSNTIEMNQL